MRSSAKKGSQRRTITNITELYKNDQINLNVLTLTLVSRPPARQTHKRRKCHEAVPYLFWQALTSYGEAGPQVCWEGNLKANYNVDCPGGNSEASGRCLFFLDQVRWKFFYSSNSCRKIWPWLGSRQVSMDCIYPMWDWNVTCYILYLGKCKLIGSLPCLKCLSQLWHETLTSSAECNLFLHRRKEKWKKKFPKSRLVKHRVTHNADWNKANCGQDKV